VSPDIYEPAMREALAQAVHAADAGDVPVGAVVLDEELALIGSGYNRREVDDDPTAHAEIVAMRAAAAARGRWRLDGCTLVVTLEPCTMCAGAVVSSRLSRLVFGAWNDDMGAVGTLWDVVRDRRLNHRPEVISGVFEAECAKPLQSFFAGQRDSGQPPSIR
jgi:tRNA(adenine34) deaminase